MLILPRKVIAFMFEKWRTVFFIKNRAPFFFEADVEYL